MSRSGVTSLPFLSILVLSAVWVAGPVLARPGRIFIVPPEPGAIAGKEARFHLLIHNPEPVTVTTMDYAKITVDLSAAGRVLSVEAQTVNRFIDGFHLAYS